MLKLHQPLRPDEWNVPNSSSHCVRLETWLRIAGIAYEIAPFPSPVAAPKGKWPYVEDNGAVLGDSSLIIEHLKRTRKIDPDDGLTPTERAIGVAFRRMAHENLYWVMAYTRYQDPTGWEANRQMIRPAVIALVGDDPQKIEEFLSGFRQAVVAQLTGHGMGRHSFDEVHQIGSEDLLAVSEFLGEKPFFFGDKPTSTDASIYAHVGSIIDVPLDNPSARFGRQRQNLVDYCRRMRERYFSDVLKA